jgi:hypothetical protein
MSQAQWHISTVAAPFDSFADSTKKIESMIRDLNIEREFGSTLLM